MTEPRDAAIHFEAVKVALKQDKNGIMLSLAIHPESVPVDLMQAFVGSRWMCALVRIGDDEQPQKGKDSTEGDRAVQSAGMLCRDPAFQRWMYRKGWAIDSTEQDVVLGLYETLGITSRTDLKTNHKARDAFLRLREEFTRGR